MKWLKDLFTNHYGKALVGALLGVLLSYTGLPAAVGTTIATSLTDTAAHAVESAGSSTDAPSGSQAGQGQQAPPGS